MTTPESVPTLAFSAAKVEYLPAWKRNFSEIERWAIGKQLEAEENNRWNFLL
jgi:hypothetical protein